MAMLVQSIVDLENEADAIIAAARDKVRELERSAEEEISAYRKEKIDEMNRRIESFREETSARHGISIGQAEKELQNSLNSMERLPDERVRAAVSHIVDRFRNRKL